MQLPRFLFHDVRSIDHQLSSVPVDIFRLHMDLRALRHLRQRDIVNAALLMPGRLISIDRDADVPYIEGVGDHQLQLHFPAAVLCAQQADLRRLYCPR